MSSDGGTQEVQLIEKASGIDWPNVLSIVVQVLAGLGLLYLIVVESWP